MTGTASQIEWAELIRPRVAAEFDRVAHAIAGRAGADEVLAILAEKRAEVLAREEAGYFIKEWQELKDQVRQLLAKDSRFTALKAKQQIKR